MTKKEPRRREPGTPATLALTGAGIAFTSHAYAHDPGAASYGLEAAAALGLEPDTVFKTLLTMVDGAPVVGIVPVSTTLDLKALAAVLGGRRCEMADGATAARLTGYVIGGISPIGQKRRLPTVIDASAEHLATMYVSGGRRGFDIGLAPTDLRSVTDARFEPIARA
ncbi:MAG: Cys-tRNA(Pro) deacylase [Actinobacteria bacterium]|jgi:Cys-tRNA(Pro)/Cys-tRNA(Cys) deacylase|nr:Cys-tRNA(Pro) deacylase [Actinomycetota bacterium]